MRQYLAVKAQVPDALLFFRMGDFYELFLEDAEQAAPLLDIALTSRDKGKPDAVPMCGVPVHSVDGYVKRLVELGHRVAICEQVEDARAAGGRRLVRREVVEVLTPGLAGDPESLDAAREVALLALAFAEGEIGLAALDASTGSFRATRVLRPGTELPRALLDELERIAPRELLLAEGEGDAALAAVSARLPALSIVRVPAESFEPARAAGAARRLRPCGAGRRAARGGRGAGVRRAAPAGGAAPGAAPAPLRPRGHDGRGRRHAPAPRAVRERRGSLAPRHADRAHRRDGDGARRAAARALARVSALRRGGHPSAPGGCGRARRRRPPARAPPERARRRARPRAALRALPAPGRGAARPGRAPRLARRLAGRRGRARRRGAGSARALGRGRAAAPRAAARSAAAAPGRARGRAPAAAARLARRGRDGLRARRLPARARRAARERQEGPRLDRRARAARA